MTSEHAFGCQVDRCIFTAYRHRVCKVHSISSTATVAGVTQRFCHYCERFHLLFAFDQRNNCRRQLADQNRRKPPAYLSLGQPGDSSSSAVEEEFDTMDPPECPDSMASPPTNGITSNHELPQMNRQPVPGPPDQQIAPAVTISGGLETGPVPSAVGQSSSTLPQNEEEFEREPQDEEEFEREPQNEEEFERELCDSISPGSEMTDYSCPNCGAEILECLDGSYQCARRSCWSKW